MVFLLGVASFLVTSLLTPLLIPRLRAAGIVGRDRHKRGQPELPEMGGLAIAAGFVAGMLLAIALETFFDRLLSVDLIILLAVLVTVLLTVLIGVLDDLLGIGQLAKALMPFLAALPLVAVKAGQTSLAIPLLGSVNFGVFYALVLVPLGLTGAANAVNMLAGFNGVEVGMGLVAMGSLAVIAASTGASTSLVILLAGIGALLATLYYNWYPAKALVGDVGTLSIGAIIAAAVIVGNFETAGVIVIIPYAVDLLFKAANGFPKSFGELREGGKLHCPSSGPVGLGQAIMKLSRGIHERTLALVLMGIEAAFGLLAIAFYARF